jgi:precorrin-6B methylase 2
MGDDDEESYFWHFDMLHDTERNEKWALAIRHEVGRTLTKLKSCRVLDIGTGSGLLGLLAARAGASGAVAYESVGTLARIAETNAKLNNLAYKVVHSHSTSEKTVQPEERFDLVVSELLDAILIGEGVLQSMRHAMSNLLSPSFRAVPASATVYAELVHSDCLRTWQSLHPNCFGHDVPSEYQACSGAASAEHAHTGPLLSRGLLQPLSQRFPVLDFDFREPGLYDGGRSTEMVVTATSSGRVDAVIVTWDCLLAEGTDIVLSTRTGSSPPRDHWRQAVYLLSGAKGSACEPVVLAVGDRAKVRVAHDDDAIWFAVNTVSSEIDGPKVEQVNLKHMHEEKPKQAKQVAETKQQHPICTCGMHTLWPRRRLWMMNDANRNQWLRRGAAAAVTAAVDTMTSLRLDRRAQPGQASQERGITAVVVVLESVTLALEVALRIKRARAVEVEEEVEEVEVEVEEEVEAVEVEVLLLCPDHATEAAARRIVECNGYIGMLHTTTLQADELAAADLQRACGTSTEVVVAAIAAEPWYECVHGDWAMASAVRFWCDCAALRHAVCQSRETASPIQKALPLPRLLPGRARLMVAMVQCADLWRIHSPVGTVESIDCTAINQLRRGQRMVIVEEEEGKQTNPNGRHADGKQEEKQEQQQEEQQEEQEQQQQEEQQEQQEQEDTAHERIRTVPMWCYPHQLLSDPKLLLVMESEGLSDGIRNGIDSSNGLVRTVVLTSNREHRDEHVCHALLLWLEFELGDGNWSMDTGKGDRPGSTDELQMPLHSLQGARFLQHPLTLPSARSEVGLRVQAAFDCSTGNLSLAVANVPLGGQYQQQDSSYEQQQQQQQKCYGGDARMSARASTAAQVPTKAMPSQPECLRASGADDADITGGAAKGDGQCAAHKRARHEGSGPSASVPQAR